MIDTEVVQSLVTALSTGLAGWFYRLLQNEIRKRPSPESYTREVSKMLNGTPKTLHDLKMQQIRLEVRQDEMEGALIRLQISHGSLSDRVESLES